MSDDRRIVELESHIDMQEGRDAHRLGAASLDARTRPRFYRNPEVAHLLTFAAPAAHRWVF